MLYYQLLKIARDGYTHVLAAEPSGALLTFEILVLSMLLPVFIAEKVEAWNEYKPSPGDPNPSEVA